MNKSQALVALGVAACASLALAGIAHPFLAPACLLAMLFKHSVLDRTRFVLPDIVFVLLHAGLFLVFVWYVLFRHEEPAFDQLSVLLGFALLWMIVRSFAQPTPYNDFLLVLASLIVMVGSAAVAAGFMPAVITGLYLVIACHALPAIMARAPVDDEGVRVRLVGKRGRWAIAGPFAVHHLALLGLGLGAGLYLAVPRFERESDAGSEADAANESLLAARRERRGTGGPVEVGQRRTGFPARLHIGDIGEIKRSPRVAFEAWLSVRGRAYDAGPRERTMLLLRADAWDRYVPGAGVWRRWDAARMKLPGDGSIGSAVGPAPVHWRVVMHGYDGKKLFLPQHVRQVIAPVAPLYVDLLGRVTADRPVRRYEAEAAMPTVGASAIRRLRPALRGRLLEVPEEIEQDLRRYARQLGAAASSRPRPGQIADAVGALQAHFARAGFTYTLSLPANLPEGQDPVLAFLERREGHCELFAAAACLLLRTMGIPARVAGGVRCAERIGLGHYRARFANAHAWVEIACANKGFVAFDFTPPDSAAAGAGVAGAGIQPDAAEQAGVAGAGGIDWRHPFRYGHNEQRALAGKLRDGLGTLALWLAGGIFLLASIVGLARTRRAVRRNALRVSAPRGVPRQALAFYAHWLKDCAGKGYRRRRSQTPREFLRGLPPEMRVDGKAVTARFEKMRYGS
ncbi:MAG: transglutaminase family protein [Planctomycetota bacterium]|jgi:transglutaminase-like putative cysteine protease